MGKKSKKGSKQQIKEGPEEEYIGHYEEAPGYMKDNDGITHGYRINFNTPKKIFKTMFTMHNESVNIWTHFIPAIIILIFLGYLLFFVGPTTLIQEFYAGKQALSSGIKSYSQALNEIGVVMKMKKFGQETEKQVMEMTQSAIEKYTHFEQNYNLWKQNIGGRLQTIQHSMKTNLIKQVKELEQLKQDFQKLFVPYIFNQIKGKINEYDPEYIQKLQTKLNAIKNKLDSDTFKYIEFPYHNIPNPHEVSRWPIFVFMVSASICLLCSTMFHLLYPMSARIYTIFSRLDYAGVNILISGSAVPFLYYSMYCNFQLAIFYLIFICTIGSTLFVVTLFDFLHKPENFTLKSLAYGGFGVSLVIPLSHGFINEYFYHNYGDPFTMVNSITYYLLVGASYLFGLYVYTVRCPQRHYPGRFNVCGQSHQIWHCFVVLGIVFTYLAVLQNFETRKVSVCPVVPFAV